ncbi:hypothetical protein A2962_04090 [Candidatus Woesebacteria bacterium RIFCSPLOWO2_01_FULL_39_61]|uniref:DNA ligase (ATP) n=1 Tax=Candidatus Woesebacteria bacterium RIFCSPHIGHO2_02_FULL_39_13 TaxID=1802505 RepID=A0A1F7YXT4_9BACT|nr:MAG: hypothetical protein A3D01_02025 [Candidatus Woesebacteria bacterium RIFCSPHIGHO2_02_FULL_39_13]OGM37249.1 MAG: hypothetical protein A3E13_03430 [Candidatus Woesebacteria bacterium RIFCSPHIGHO2_12_FULL_40_20]OGM65933.1 MAG: hypothetical protein A2962_04090 [Candidatus Woesebacteria bacterium RIFCSPLOWO2_01_FULL_39_61]OGM71426.1 MAG: hypothetical protein A3H19_04645 [Candidatus Woesebacteria bacterium RIFCSPLOWO2_12_FULL_39_9]
MKFEKLSVYLDKLEKTSSRIEITKILADLFKEARYEEIDKIVYLLLGSLAPSYEGVVFNLAERMMMRILAKAFGKEVDYVTRLYKQKGDLGEVAQELATTKGTNISVSEIYEKLLAIAQEHGDASQERKINETANVLSMLDPLSARFVARIPVGRLRLGFSDKTILDALSWMETGGKSKKADLESAYNIRPDVGLLARMVKERGIEKAAKEIDPHIGVPIMPMLAQRLKSPSEMIEKMKRVYVEPKFDGLRIQIHYKKSGFDNGKRVKAFTRNLNETSWMFPELNEIEKQIAADDVILDSEAIGVDEERKTLANFQTTMTRRRKHDIEQIAAKMKIRFYVFDLMLKNQKSLINETYIKRREELDKTIKKGNVLQVVNYEVTERSERINELMRKELKEGMEGIIVKRADSSYIAGRTGWRWVKMKEEETSYAKLADTIDCVVMGYSAGRGKRVGFGLGQFLVGVRDGDEVKTVTKVGTGLTDEQFRELKRRLKGLEVKEKPKNYLVNKLLEPDYWVTPEIVVEIAADEITKSPTHTAGLALRFPRLIKFRDDKSYEEATTVGELKNLFKLQ